MEPNVGQRATAIELLSELSSYPLSDFRGWDEASFSYRSYPQSPAASVKFGLSEEPAREFQTYPVVAAAIALFWNNRDLILRALKIAAEQEQKHTESALPYGTRLGPDGGNPPE